MKGTFKITIDGTSYEIFKDSYTGDYCLLGIDREFPQERWFIDKQSAINYLMYHTGLYDEDEVEYERAPTRCDA